MRLVIGVAVLVLACTSGKQTGEVCTMNSECETDHCTESSHCGRVCTCLHDSDCAFGAHCVATTDCGARCDDTSVLENP